MSLPSQKWSACQEKALKILETGADNIFLTGRAGTGKSFLIRHFLKSKDPKTFPVVASTGAAAIVVGGRTFHSFFGLGIMEGGFQKTVDRALKDHRVVKRLKKIIGFVLDEISMVPGPALKAAETICRFARKKNLPWGGVRVIAVGDFAQLPPVTRVTEKREWAFLDDSWQRSGFVPLLLKTVMRSEDEAYVHILNLVRDGIVNEDVKSYLDSRTNPSPGKINVTHLFPHREKAEKFNLERLSEIKKKLHQFPTTYSGNDRFVEQLKKQAPIPEILQIKESAMVMIRMNDPYLKYVNGSLGTVLKIKNDSLEIRLKNGRSVEIEPAKFSVLDANGNEMATATNFPITLAYGSTIHKAQGATLDGMVCDLRRLWEPGQAYVALSRLRRGDDLVLTGWDEPSIRVDPEVVAFHQGLTDCCETPKISCAPDCI